MTQEANGSQWCTCLYSYIKGNQISWLCPLTWLQNTESWEATTSFQAVTTTGWSLHFTKVMWPRRRVCWHAIIRCTSLWTVRQAEQAAHCRMTLNMKGALWPLCKISKVFTAVKTAIAARWYAYAEYRVLMLDEQFMECICISLIIAEGCAHVTPIWSL